MESSSSKEFVAKLLIIGDQGVGKSCILSQFADNFYTPNSIMTAGIDFKTKKIKIDNKEVKLQIWDTAGQEKYRSITQSFYKNAMGVFIVFDLTSQESFDNIKNWIRQVKNHAHADVYKMLLGNKCDVEVDKKIPKDQIAELVNELNIEYYETSAKANVNINEAFYQIAKQIKAKAQKDEQNNENSSATKTPRYSLNNSTSNNDKTRDYSGKSGGCC